ncbi:DHA2 family multidrug resistance protein OS=Castellaniella defragrans OX=75697 GN=HNR28_000470 PE=4 SV=1 [Castellaniella defragrans]
MQNTLGYTALWSGFAVAPIGFIPILLTFWVGKYAAKFDLRWLTAVSFAVMSYVCFRFGSFNTDVDFASIAFTEFILGLGVALFFMPILTILLSDLEGSEISRRVRVGDVPADRGRELRGLHHNLSVDAWSVGQPCASGRVHHSLQCAGPAGDRGSGRIVAGVCRG